MKLLRGFRSGIEGLKLYRRRLLPFCASASASSRCLSSSDSDHEVTGPWNLLDALSKYPSITVAEFSGSGRGLVAASNIKYGDTVLMELPLLCYQSSALADQVCYGCLMVLPPHSLHLTSPLSGRHFCSEDCMAGCEARFHALESLALRSALPPSALPPGPQHPTDTTSDPHASSPLSAFEAMCVMNGERFPLMVARLAFTRLTRALTQVAGGAPNPPATPPPGLPPVVSGDPVTDLGFLCYANVPEPYPEPWVHLYQQLRQAMEAAVEAAEQQLAEAADTPQAQERAGALRDELEQLSLDWFVAVLSRLHINVFRVGCLLPQSSDRSAGGQWLGPQLTSSGSAAYLTASMFNHSCEPNVEVIFRRNDSTAAFVAARDIDQGEQLFVSYMDESLSLKARQDHLLFAYGFKCRCQRCVEEEEDAAA